MNKRVKPFFCSGIFLFLLFSTRHCIAQTPPGYQGKRLVLLYEFNVHPYLNMVDFLINEQTTGINNPVLLYSHSFSLDYVLNRKSMIGATFNYFTFSDPSPITYADNQGSPVMYNYSGTGMVYSIYFKLFRQRRRAIAPLGKYVKPELSVLYYSGTELISGGTNSYYGTSTRPSEQVFTTHPAPRIGFSYSVGKTFILFDRLMIDRGIRFSLVNLARIGNANLSNATTGYIADPAALLVFNNQTINFFIGIGLLPGK